MKFKLEDPKLHHAAQEYLKQLRCNLCEAVPKFIASPPQMSSSDPLMMGGHIGVRCDCHGFNVRLGSMVTQDELREIFLRYAHETTRLTELIGEPPPDLKTPKKSWVKMKLNYLKRGGVIL